MKAIVFCAHADDEVIGMGGTLRLLADAGASIRLVMFSAGAEGFSSAGEKDSIVARRAEETRHVCRILGVSEYFNLGKLDWSLGVDNSGYRAVIQHLRDFQPDLAFTHSCADYNDHRAVHAVVTEGWFHASIACAVDELSLSRQMPLYEFEVIQTMNLPSVVMDITQTYEAKKQAMACYASQHEVVGGVFQMMEGRALERGALVGVRYGEAFRRSNYRPRLASQASALFDSL